MLVDYVVACGCKTLPEAFYLEDAADALQTPRKTVDVGDWVALEECEQCGTLWAIDEWDKYSHQVASRVTNREGWKAASEAQRKALLLSSRGGVAEEPCAWVDCETNRVQDVAYCVDHLYSTGARK